MNAFMHANCKMAWQSTIGCCFPEGSTMRWYAFDAHRFKMSKSTFLGKLTKSQELRACHQINIIEAYQLLWKGWTVVDQQTCVLLVCVCVTCMTAGSSTMSRLIPTCSSGMEHERTHAWNSVETMINPTTAVCWASGYHIFHVANCRKLP